MMLVLLVCVAVLAWLFQSLVLARQRVPLAAIKERRHVRDAEMRATLKQDAACEAAQAARQGRRTAAAAARREGGAQRGAASASALVLPLESVGQDDADLVGGKGAHLGELCSFMPVPGGFCVTKAAYEQQAAAASQPAVLDAIAQAYAALGKVGKDAAEGGESGDSGSGSEGGGALVAVRSSATCEDAADASFAGQLESYLGVRGEANVLEAVRKCWASLQSDRVKAYSALMGGGAATGASVACCVVVQCMVDPVSAGVLFTANPLSRRRGETVVTGSWGLGEAVVADLVTPDTWVVDTASGAVLSEEISPCKDVMHVMDAPTFNGSVLVPVEPPSRRGERSVSAEQLGELVRLGSAIQTHYGSPRDVEWAVERGSGRVLILQARPITTALLDDDGDGHGKVGADGLEENEEESENEREVSVSEFDSTCRPGDWLTTCNAREMFPGAVSFLCRLLSCCQF